MGNTAYRDNVERRTAMSKLQTVLEKHVKDPKIVEQILADMKVERASNVKYVRTGEQATAKLAPQARQILDAVDAKTPRSGTEIAELAVKNGLKTKQEPYRIFAWYRKVLLDQKLIKAA